MVVSAITGLYSPFQHAISMIPEEGAQSSEDGSGLHSPVYGTFPTHGDNFRYQHEQLNVHHTTSILTSPPYGYPHIHAQQPPILTSLEPLISDAREVDVSPHFAFAQQQQQRNQIVFDFPVQSGITSRIPSTDHSGGPIDYRYSNPTERRFPSGHTHGQTYGQTYARNMGHSSAITMDNDHRPFPVTTSPEEVSAAVANSSKGPRKEASSVVIACRQCRFRKIRCDSTRPICNNCVRRSNSCEYDAAPKRRGPDRNPGTRKRASKRKAGEEPETTPSSKRKRTTAVTSSEPRETAAHRVKENMTDAKRSPSVTRHDVLQRAQTQASPNNLEARSSSDPLLLLKHDGSPTYHRPPSYDYEQGSYVKSSFPRQLDVNTFQSAHAPHRKFPMPVSPTVESEQKAWWAKILNQYRYTARDIIDEVTFLMDNTGSLLSFINPPFLMKRLLSDVERLLIQPSFILASLAMAKLIKSSSVEEGHSGLQQATILLSDAHRAFQDACRAGWIDAALAEAALILALFESSAYPDHTPERELQALVALDRIIQLTQLTTNDNNDPDASTFGFDAVPAAVIDYGPEDPLYPHRSCSCLSSDTVGPPDQYTHRSYILPWDVNWHTNQIRDEEIRRLCWSALSLISGYIAQCIAFNKDPPKLYLSDSANYTLFFPGELIDRNQPNYLAPGSLAPKESIWALYCRSMLLWNFCNRFRHQPDDSEEKTENIAMAFGESQVLLDSLNMHTCNLDTTIMYMCREYIFNTQMLVTQALRRSVSTLKDGTPTTPGPIFKRNQAAEWLYYQDQVIRRVNATIHHLNGSEGHQLTRRPFRVSWFMNQLQICLILWNHDNSLEDALKLAKAILPSVDVMNALWPCHTNRQQSDALRQQLIEACTVMNIDLPFPPSYSIPSFIRTA